MAGRTLQFAACGADAKAMRELLEFLGLVASPPGRREPVALPAWARWAVPAAVAAMAALSLLVLATVRLLLG